MSRLRAIANGMRRALPELLVGFGILALSFGAWLAAPAAGWIVLGVACIGVVRFGTDAA